MLHRNIKTEPETFLQVIHQFRDDMVISAE